MKIVYVFIFIFNFKAMLLLLGSALSESGTLIMAYMDTKENAKKLGLTFWDYVAQGNTSFNLSIFKASVTFTFRKKE